MARYFFDVSDGEQIEQDNDGLEFTELYDVKRAAVDGLADLLREALPDGSRRRFTMVVRSEGGKTVLTCSLALDVTQF